MKLWNMGETDKKYLSEGQSVELLLQAYSEVNQNVTNSSFKKTKLKIFDGNYALEDIDLSSALEEEENEKLVFEELEKKVSYSTKSFKFNKNFSSKSWVSTVMVKKQQVQKCTLPQMI